MSGTTPRDPEPLAGVPAKAPAHDELVYGIDPNTGLAVFGDRSQAALLEVWASARNWGDVRAILPDDEVEDLRAGYWFEEDDHIPSDDEPFDVTHTGGFDDGYWPIPLRFTMAEWMPKDLISRYGSVRDTPDGEYLAIEPENLEIVANELRARGHTCVRDHDLVDNASVDYPR